MVATAFFGDLLVIASGLLSAFWIRFQSGWAPPDESVLNLAMRGRRALELVNYTPHFALGAVLLLLLLAYFGLYDFRFLLRYRRAAVLIVKAAVAWCFVYLGAAQVLKLSPDISRGYALIALATCGVGLLLWRWLLYLVARSRSMAERLRQRILFVGWNKEADRMAQSVLEDASHPYEIVGCVPSAQGRYALEPRPDVRRLGDYNHLPDLLESGVDIVVVADLDPVMGEMVSLANLCEKNFVQYKIIPSYFQILVSGLHLETVSGVPILGVERLPLDRFINRFLKRAVDIVGAGVGLLLSAPVIALCGLIVYLESPGPIFYRQVRTGRNGKNFRIIKIRSMRLDAERGTGARWASKDDPRRLRIGKYLREWNLDEVPQFWNVLAGEMSLVGPRPERPELIANFKHEIPHYNARHGSKPGITGWAQVHGLRGDTDLAERIRYDIYYLENWSLLLDFQIMFMTFVSRKNAY